LRQAFGVVGEQLVLQLALAIGPLLGNPLPLAFGPLLGLALAHLVFVYLLRDGQPRLGRARARPRVRLWS